MLLLDSIEEHAAQKLRAIRAAKLRDNNDPPLSPFMSAEELEQWSLGGHTEYAGFHVVPKRDFGKVGHYMPEGYIRAGWLVVKDGVNVMPGAVWALTRAEALQMIDVWIACGEDATKFHHLLKAVSRRKGEA